MIPQSEIRDPESVHLIVVRNPFDHTERDDYMLPAQSTVAQIIAAQLPVSVELVAAINGELVTREEWETRTLKPGEQMVVMPLVLKDNGILGTVLMIGLSIAAPGIGSSIAGAMNLGSGTIMGIGWGQVIGMGVSMLGSAIIGGLTAPNKPLPNSAGLQSFNNSPTYSWTPVTTQQPGGPVSRCYGLHKLYGNIIAGYISTGGSTGQNQTAHLLIDLGAGPYAQLSDFRINDQPVGYYSGVKITARMGHLNQDTIPAFNDTRANHSIAAKVVQGTPVVRDTVGTDYDALEILLVCPNGLWYANDAGGMDSISVYVSVEISADNGVTWSHVATEPHTIITVAAGYWSRGYWTGGENNVWAEKSTGGSVTTSYTEGELWATVTQPRQKWRWMAIPTKVASVVNNSITLSGNSQQPIRRQLRVDHLVRGTRYKVRCSNLSADQTSARWGDDVYLSELNEVMYDDFQYPRTVLACANALANNQLSGSIKFSCLAKGAIVRVWNGTAWASAWSNNPAWVCFDILTQPVLDNALAVVRYDGLDPSRINLASFKAWADFCDVVVPDGRGGTEARCTFDGVFDTPTSLWDAALEVCASARAQLVLRGTSVMVVCDDVRATPAQLFSVGNTAVGGFHETFLPMQDRAASIEVNYVDALQGYVRDTTTVVNTAVTESASARTQVGLRGVTRASQAWREANFRLKRNELLKRAASLGVDIDALACTVGDLIWLQNDVTQWGVGGRAAVGSTTTRLQLDQGITLATGKTYELKLRLSDDTLLTRTITTAAGTVSAVDVSVAFPSAPALYDVWAIGETSKAVKEFIVLDITRDTEQRAKLALIEYNASLYGLDSGIPALPTQNVAGTSEYVDLSALPSLSNVRVEEMIEVTPDDITLVHLDIYFDTINTQSVDVFEGGQRIGVSTTGVFRRSNAIQGVAYSFSLHPVGFSGMSPIDSWVDLAHTVSGGGSTPVPDVDTLNAVYEGTVVWLSWNPVNDTRRLVYEVRCGDSWGSGAAYQVGAGTRFKVVKDGTWWVAAKTVRGAYSVNPKGIRVEGAVMVVNVISAISESTTGWGGAQSGVYEPVPGQISLAGTALFSSHAAVSAVQDIVLAGGFAGSGTYTIPAANRVDIGIASACQVSAALDYDVYDPLTTIGAQPVFSALPSVKCPLGGTGSVGLEMNLAQSDGIYSGWQIFVPGTYLARLFDFRLKLASTGASVTPVIRDLTTTIDVPDRIDSAQVATPAAPLVVTFAKPFNAAPKMQITIMDATANDDAVLSAISAAGFTLAIKNGGANMARNVHYLAQGY